MRHAYLALFEDMFPTASYINRGGARPSFDNHLSIFPRLATHLRLDVNSDAAQLPLSQKSEKDAIAQ